MNDRCFISYPAAHLEFVEVPLCNPNTPDEPLWPRVSVWSPEFQNPLWARRKT